MSWKKVQPLCWFCICCEMPGTLEPLLSQLSKIGTHREVGIGGHSCRLTRHLMGPPPRWNNSDEFGSSQLSGNKELKANNSFGWSWMLRITEVEKMLGGGWRLEKGASLDLFHPNNVEARNRSAGLLSALLKKESYIAKWNHKRDMASLCHVPLVRREFQVPPILKKKELLQGSDF